MTADAEFDEFLSYGAEAGKVLSNPLVSYIEVRGTSESQVMNQRLRHKLALGCANSVK